MTPVTFLVTSDVDDALLEDVVIRIYNEAGTVLITQGSTGVDGEYTLDLADATYWVRFFKSGFSFESKALIEVDVLLSNLFEVEGVDLDTNPSAVDVNLCRVSGRVITGSGADAPFVVIKFTLSGVPRVVAGRTMLPTTVYAKTNASGWFEQDLVRNGIYEAWLTGLEDSTIRVRVPDYPWVALADLVFPYVKTVEFEDNTLAVAVGDDVETSVTVTLSSRLEVPYDFDDDDSLTLAEILTFSIDDTDVATFTMDADGLITITGVTAGTATLSATALDVAAVRQPVVAPVFETIVITVT